MSRTRRVIQRFMTHIERLEFGDAFGMIAEDGSYTVIGKTQASRRYNGRKDVFERLIPVLSNFKAPPVLKFSAPIVEGNRAALFAAGAGEGATGPYDQPFYAFRVEVRGDELLHVVEFLDTANLETAMFGKKVVDAA